MRLTGEVANVTVARGRKVVSFEMKTDPPDEAMLLKHILGPTGNLRAPTIKMGESLLVGFNHEMYQSVFKD